MGAFADELFQFVEDDSTKQVLEKDWEELHQCMNLSLWKSAIVLIGSLMETVLYYVISSRPSLKARIERFDRRNDVGLANLLKWARQSGILSDNLYKLSDPIREYRNLIHPRVRERSKQPMNENVVRMGYHVLLEMLREISEYLERENAQSAVSMIEKIVQEVEGRTATRADVVVYKPILEKYGHVMGGQLIRRSLAYGSSKKEKR